MCVQGGAYGEKLLDRICAIGTPIAIAANNAEISAGYGTSSITEFPYTFKIIDSDDVTGIYDLSVLNSVLKAKGQSPVSGS